MKQKTDIISSNLSKKDVPDIWWARFLTISLGPGGAEDEEAEDEKYLANQSSGIFNIKKT